MNEQFIEGFVKKAIDLGFDDDTIVGLFKSAMGQPDPQAGPSQMFNTLPQLQPGGVPPQQDAQRAQVKAALQQMMTNPQQAGQLQQLLGTH